MIGGYSQDGGFTNGLIHPSLILRKAMLSGVNGAIDYVQIKHKNGISTLYFKSYQQGREKFQGARCHLIHLDEEPPKDIYTECAMRLADVDGLGQGRLILTMTPLKGYTEMMSYFLEQRISKVKSEEITSIEELVNQEDYELVRTDPEVTINGKYYIQATWDDNLHLSEDTKKQLRATLKPYELEAREKGIPITPAATSLILHDIDNILPGYIFHRYCALLSSFGTVISLTRSSIQGYITYAAYRFF